MYTSRHRAAVLCFGTWGLQTMLHLWPRLRFIQEERLALGIENQLPNLNLLTAFAAIVPQPLRQAQESRYKPFRILRPLNDRYPEPFYIERVLHDVHGKLEPSEDHPEAYRFLSYSERIGVGLTKKLLEEGTTQYVEELSVRSPPWNPPLQHNRILKQEIFESAIVSAEAAARTIVQQVIDPTRLDNVQAMDPLVQTTLYVVASLAEPLTAAILWPIVAELVATIGNQNVANTVAILGTGSFAPDSSRTLEEASCYASLVELEELLGIQVPPGDTITPIKRIVGDMGGEGWAGRVGKQLFSRIYLVDKEKSNQALASDPHELAVLTSNAIESFLIADGASYLEKQLAADPVTHGVAPYSILGAASDYVPLAQYIIAAIREEQKRVVREEVLEGGREADVAQITLQQLNAEPESAVRNLLTPGALRMFDAVSDRNWVERKLRPQFLRVTPPWRRQGVRAERAVATWLPQLQVSRRFIISDRIAEQLDSVRTLWEWRQLAENQVTLAGNRLREELVTRQMEEAWGLNHHVPQLFFGEELQTEDRATAQREALEARLRRYQTRSWAGRHQNDSRTIPIALMRVLRTVVEDLSRGPEGLRLAQQKVGGLIDKVDSVLDEDLAEGLPEEEWNHRYGMAIRRWQQQFFDITSTMPHLNALRARGFLVTLFLTYVIVSWLMWESGPRSVPMMMLYSVATLFTLSMLLIVVPRMFIAWRIRRLRNRRIALAQQRLSRTANTTVRNSLHRLYQNLRDDLQRIDRILKTTLEELESYSKPEDPLHVPTRDVRAAHLRTAHTNNAIWSAIQRLLREHRNSEGKTAQQRFLEQWEKEGKDVRNWIDGNERLVERFRIALEVPFNEREHLAIINALSHLPSSELQAQTGLGSTVDFRNDDSSSTTEPRSDDATAEAKSQQLIEASRLNGWCCFAEWAPNATPPPACTACPNPHRFHCAFSEEGTKKRKEWSLHAIIREYVLSATQHLLPNRRMLPEQHDFMRQVATKYAIEHLVFDEALSDSQSQASSAAFVERLFARAKPAANFDVINPVSFNHLNLDFAVTADPHVSMLVRPLEQLRMPLLTSHDPMSISMVRTINGLTLDDLLLVDRCRREFHRLHEDDLNYIWMLGAEERTTAAQEHKEDGMVAYEPIFS